MAAVAAVREGSETVEPVLGAISPDFAARAPNGIPATVRGGFEPG
jgi:hypothetical protein